MKSSIVSSKVRASFLIAGASLLTATGFVNCSSPKFGSAQAPVADVASGIVDPTDTQEQHEIIVAKACEAKNTFKRSQHIRFANPRDPASPKKSCNWGKDGNAGSEDLRQSTASDPDTDPNKMTEDRFTARAEQKVLLDLPANAVICGVNFKFSNQAMTYDDHMLLMYDDVVLAATKPVAHLLNNESSMSIYDWSKLVMQKWQIADSVAYTYCFGADTGDASCSWPKSATSGTIQLSYDPSILQKVTARNLSRAQHSFTMVTTGDNNPEVDCQHSDMEFDVEMSYSSL